MINRTTARLMAICVAFATTATAQTAVAQDKPAVENAAAAQTAPAGAGKLLLPNGQDMTPDHIENGRWYNSEGIPTYKIAEDGTLDYATFSGYRRYSAECHVCHGPDGEGSTYAPALKTSVLNLDYYAFQEIVASGKQDVNKAANLVMPAFGTNKNVWCYIDDIYAYLLARGVGDLPRGRPAKKEAKSDDFAAQENSCMEG
jgi:methanol metabolism-related c-type cytochrome